MLNTHEYCLVFNKKTQTELKDFYDRKLEEDMNQSEEIKTNEWWV
jgi:hypothetical protein